MKKKEEKNKKYAIFICTPNGTLMFVSETKTAGGWRAQNIILNGFRETVSRARLLLFFSFSFFNGLAVMNEPVKVRLFSCG